MAIVDVFNMLTDGTATDAQAENCIMQAELIIKSYCNLDELPHELAPVTAAMASDIFDGAKNGVKAIKQGDTTVTYSDSSAHMNTLLLPYLSVLRAYRRLSK
ncbi:MAG: hypothetical protein E7491_06545 [Ruminococcaceae bacterium]|nr:hypothetical protein [Oscillospiraceae bacterium]